MGNFFPFFTSFFMNFLPFWQLFGKFLRKIRSCWHPYCDVGVPTDASIVVDYSLVLYFLHPCFCGSPFCCWRCNVPIISIAVGLPPCWCLLCLQASCFWLCPYCVGGPVVANIPAVACCLLLWVVMIMQSSLCCLLLALLMLLVSLMLVCGRHSCCCWRPLSSWGFPVAGLSAVDGILAVASVPADPCVPILAGGFTYWIFRWYVLYYRTIGL